MARKPAKPTKKKITTKAVQASEELPPPVDPAKVELPVKPEDEGDAPWGNDCLTHKQRQFVKALVGPAAGNATKAAAMAGYSDSNRHVLEVTASENLRKPEIQRAIGRALAEREGGPEWTRQGIVEIARSNAADYLRYDEATKSYVPDLRAMANAGALGTLKKLKFHPDTGAIVEVQQHDKLQALTLLAKMHGIAPDQTNVTFTTPQQKALGGLLRDPEAMAMARKLADRLNVGQGDATGEEGGNVANGHNHNGNGNGNSNGHAKN